MSNLVILKWQPFEYKAKFEKRSLLFRSKLGVLTCFLKDCTKKVLKIYKSIVIKNFKPVPLCPIKWQPFKVVAKLHESPLLIANTVDPRFYEHGFYRIPQNIEQNVTVPSIWLTKLS